MIIIRRDFNVIIFSISVIAQLQQLEARKAKRFTVKADKIRINVRDTVILLSEMTLKQFIHTAACEYVVTLGDIVLEKLGIATGEC